MINSIKLAQQVQDDVIKWRRDLHQIPELGLELPKTVAYVAKVLDELGIEYDSSYVNGNGIVAHIYGQKDGKTDRVLGTRADMDGLPIKEDTGLSFSSTNENMHACGHDGHTAMLLGAAKVLKENADQFSGVVKLVFQPGEEYPGGAEPMVKEGALLNPQATRMIGFHMGELVAEMPKGSVLYKDGPMMASMDRLYIKVKGKGAHGAYPEISHDPIVAAGQLVTAIQTIKSRNIKAVDPCVVSITRIEGGFNQNIIPDEVEIEGTVRTFNDETRRKIHEKLEQISRGIGAAMGVDCEVTYDYKYPAVINDTNVTQEVTDSLAPLFGEDLIELTEPLMGGEDYSYYLREVPGTFLYLTNPQEVDGVFHGHHHPKFDVDETLFYKGVASFVQVAFDYLNER